MEMKTKILKEMVALKVLIPWFFFTKNTKFRLLRRNKKKKKIIKTGPEEISRKKHFSCTLGRERFKRC